MASASAVTSPAEVHVPVTNLAALDPIHPRNELERRVERRGPAVAHGKRARHAGPAGERLRHTEHLVERRREEAAVHATGRALVRRAERHVTVDRGLRRVLPTGSTARPMFHDLEPNRWRERIGKPMSGL